MSTMIETCEKLTQYVRRNLDSSNAIAFMKVHEQQGFVSFRWYERDFVVKRSLEVFEVKGQNLLVTGASMLMQAVLNRAEVASHSVEGIVGSIRTAEDLIADEQQRDSGFKLLASIKATLMRMANHKPEAPHANLSSSNGGPAKDLPPHSATTVEPVAAR